MWISIAVEPGTSSAILRKLRRAYDVREAHKEKMKKFLCKYCLNDENLPPESGQHDFRVMEDGLFYFDSQLGWERITINFCPVCGRPLTDEAVQMVINRIEEMENAN